MKTLESFVRKVIPSLSHAIGNASIIAITMFDIILMDNGSIRKIPYEDEWCTHLDMALWLYGWDKFRTDFDCKIDDPLDDGAYNIIVKNEYSLLFARDGVYTIEKDGVFYSF